MHSSILLSVLSQGGKAGRLESPAIRATAEECIALATEKVRFLDDGTTFVPVSAIMTLRQCLDDKGFSSDETEIVVDAFLSVGE